MSSSPITPAPAPRRRLVPRLRIMQGAAALLIAFGVGGTVVHLADGHRHPTVLALTPGPIAAVKDGTPAAFKGQVADVFGNKFVIADDTGRALVDTGPSGDGRDLVTTGETVTVQGRFERGSLHAAMLSHADGHADALDAGPGFGPPHHPGPPWLHAGF